MNKKLKEEIVSYYRKHISDEVMPFWDARCIDKKYGGYLTCFDRQGNLTDDKKYGWFQGRQLYVYSLLYNKFEKKSEWLDNARHGYEFLVKYAYAGNGRWNYVMDRRGNVLEGTISIFSDFHIIHGIAEYLKIDDVRDQKGIDLLQECFEVMEQNMFDSEFKEIYENTWSSVYIWHDMYLTCLATTEACTEILGLGKTKKLLRECVDKIENWFASKEYRVIFEAVTRKNTVSLDTEKGRFVNPGHMHESAWFCMKAGEILSDKEVTRQGIEIAGWANRIGKDKEYGGIISYADALGKIPEPIDWFKETNSLWNDKVWWPNAEALAAYAIAYYYSRNESYLEEFWEQHIYCKEHFFDAQYGEWYERLETDGKIKNSDKGTPWKCAFHLVRALVFTWETFMEMEE